jgi:hypothetical protein
MTGSFHLTTMPWISIRFSAIKIPDEVDGNETKSSWPYVKVY